jgi:succinyl-CoA synthetase beta subunit
LQAAGVAVLELFPLPLIGCIVNGAGLGLATLDIVRLYGATPANFLDLGGNVTTTKGREGYRIVSNDPRVQGILVNVFGGIDHCDIIAEGVLQGVREYGLRVPMVIRLQGTLAAEGRAIVERENHPGILALDDLDEAAQAIVHAVQMCESFPPAKRRVVGTASMPDRRACPPLGVSAVRADASAETTK